MLNFSIKKRKIGMEEEIFNQKMDFPEMEKNIIKYWDERKIFEKLRKKNENGEIFTFLEGPPTANGHPHMGHALTRAAKDVVLRYMAMNGKNVYPWIGGWDCHGLPVELEVEKELKINSKKEIERFGVENFNRKCRESVFKYKNEWEEMTRRIGFWLDLENAYVTMNKEYVESVWWALNRIWKMGLLEKDFKIVPYCPRCGTPLSSHEVAQGYKDTEDPSLYVKFKARDEDAFYLVWTTTPWTLPSNLFLAVNENVEYCLVKYKDEKYYLACSVVDKLTPGAEIIKRMMGKDLLGRKYERLIPDIEYDGNVFFIVSGDFVTTEEGTGIVHIAPAFGADDFEIGKKYNVKILNPVDREGKFHTGPWKGLFVKDADKKIIERLKHENKVFKYERIVHTYPFCWRCNTPLLYYPLDTWFIKVSKVRDKIIENNEKINWIPDHLKHGRFGNFLNEAKDWALSRDRYWGTPLPVWKCKNNHYFVPESFNDLLKRSLKEIKDFDPHRPYVDEIKIKCDICGEEMVREPYVIDTWFDSGSASFAQYHYPFENSDKVKWSIPYDFITEAIDQTRGWFYTLHVISTLLFEKNAYKNVLTLGLVLNEKGEKMSKSKGDYVDPLPIMDSLGADALRLYLYSTPLWRDRRVGINLIREYKSRTIDTLWNSYVFYRSNSKLDKFIFDNGNITEKIDKWLISELNSTIECVNESMKEFEIHKGVNCIENFLDKLSNWYIRRSRRRFWDENVTEEKLSGYRTLYIVFRDLSRLMAPFTPFITEYIYRDLTGEESVHLAEYPKENKDLIDKKLEKEMNDVIKIVEMGRRARQMANIKTRQPLEKIVVIGEKNILDEIKEYESMILDELNVKKIIYDERRENYIKYSVDINYKVIGPIVKEKVNNVKEEILKMDPLKIKEMVENNLKINVLGFDLPPESFTLKEETDDNFVLVSENGLYVLLDKEINRDLLYEGLAREIVRRIQIMRKEMNLAYADRILVEIKTDDDELKKAIEMKMEYIESETLSKIVENVDNCYTKTWDIDGKEITISIKKI